MFRQKLVSYAQMRVGKQVGFHIKCELFLSDFNWNWNMCWNISKFRSIRFYKNPFSCFQIVPWGSMDMHGEANRWIFAAFRRECVQIKFHELYGVDVNVEPKFA
jgi:hypothetical protein